MTNKQEQQLREMFREKLQEQYSQGMITGSKAIAGAILDKAKSEVSDAEKIADIICFCERSLGVKPV